MKYTGTFGNFKHLEHLEDIEMTDKEKRVINKTLNRINEVYKQLELLTNKKIRETISITVVKNYSEYINSLNHRPVIQTTLLNFLKTKHKVILKQI